MDREQNATSLFSKNWNMADETSTDEQPLTNISVMAIICLLGGFLSFLLYFSVYFCFIPVVTFFLCLLTLYRIHCSEGILVGRAMVWIALWLLVVPCIAIPVQQTVFRNRACNDARRYFETWFEAARTGNFEKIKQMQHVPHFVEVKTTGAGYWKQFTRDEELHAQMHQFLKNPLLLTLATLGDRAKIAWFRTDVFAHSPESDQVLMTYSVTYPTESGSNETFFMQINGTRSWDNDKNTAGWVGGSNVKGPLDLDADGNPTTKAEK